MSINRYPPTSAVRGLQKRNTSGTGVIANLKINTNDGFYVAAIGSMFTNKEFIITSACSSFNYGAGFTRTLMSIYVNQTTTPNASYVVTSGDDYNYHASETSLSVPLLVPAGATLNIVGTALPIGPGFINFGINTVLIGTLTSAIE